MNRSRALSLLFVVGSSLSCLGCGSSEEAAPAAPPPAAPRPPPVDALEAAMRAREETDAFALTPYEPPFRATLEEGDRQTFSAVLRDGFCYKLLAQSADGVADLDLFLYDQNGVLEQTDAREGPHPVLGGERPICPQEPGIHRAEVRMVRGHGAVLAQWYVNQSL
ncbi:MAG: hypothetical protein U0353_22095 [Sandaracinus sp.]